MMQSSSSFWSVHLSFFYVHADVFRWLSKSVNVRQMPNTWVFIVVSWLFLNLQNTWWSFGSYWRIEAAECHCPAARWTYHNLPVKYSTCFISVSIYRNHLFLYCAGKFCLMLSLSKIKGRVVIVFTRKEPCFKHEGFLSCQNLYAHFEGVWWFCNKEYFHFSCRRLFANFLNP